MVQKPVNIDLQKRLEAVDTIIQDLKNTEEEYFALEAHKDVLFSSLFRQSMETSVAAKEAAVYASEEWRDFSKALALYHAAHNEMRRKYELRMKAFDAEYLSVKIDGQIIPRGMQDDRRDREG